MAKMDRKAIQKRAREILEDSPRGIRWVELLRRVEVGNDDTPHNSVHGGIHALLLSNQDEIVKIARGIYQLKKYSDSDNALPAADAAVEITAVPSEGQAPSSVTEQDFYASFADWLIENDEVTMAFPLGGASLGGKWGTPDVIGVLKPRAADIFKFEPQIVTAEIKAVGSQPVVAFGQAVAYRLFSHKSYVVIPRSSNKDDISRLTSLCSIHGTGLVLFTIDKENPNYETAVIPGLAAPDMFYVNNMLERLKVSEADILNKLF